MKVRNSLRSLKNRHRDCRIVRRKGRVYVINKTQRRFKARQGQNHQARRCAKKAALRGGFLRLRAALQGDGDGSSRKSSNFQCSPRNSCL